MANVNTRCLNVSHVLEVSSSNQMSKDVVLVMRLIIRLCDLTDVQLRNNKISSEMHSKIKIADY